MEINALIDEDSGLIRDVENRLIFAETIYRESIVKYKQEWESAVASIANREECPEYNGLVMEPMIGFVPIDRDPESGLWEFSHLQTGSIPERGPEGKLMLTEETGLVFVLIPAGTFTMGAQKEDPGSPNYDPLAAINEYPPHEVSINPFLLSKYEMTQGQWLRFLEENPSRFKPGNESDVVEGKPFTLLHPVEYLSWEDCDEALSCMKLRLPAEAEWEYACRAGTGTAWYTGDDKESLEGTCNIADRFAMKFRVLETRAFEEWLDDGYLYPAPVGSFAANLFGLHDMIGNVSERCQDAFARYTETPTDGSAFEPENPSYRVRRGGSWGNHADYCRSAFRVMNRPHFRTTATGVRPAADLP
ncbi:MAG: formylglycine-generating enzyme family protein [Planctomycetota bacterium]